MTSVALRRRTEDKERERSRNCGLPGGAVGEWRSTLFLLIMKEFSKHESMFGWSSGGHLTHLYMLKPFWKDKDHFLVTFDKEDARSLLQEEKICHYYGVCY